jgi:hypothetical protein
MIARTCNAKARRQKKPRDLIGCRTISSLCAVSCLFVAIQLMGLSSAHSQSYSLPYARLLTSEEAGEVLHCPWCNEALFVPFGPTLLVRTAEGVNLTFANFEVARSAAELLNSMASAKNHCAQTEYNLIGQPDDQPAQDQDNAGSVFSLYNSHHDLTALAEYVVPPFQDCAPHYPTKIYKPELHHRRTKREPALAGK